MLKNIQTMPKKQLAFVYIATLSIEFILAIICLIFVPWLSLALVIAGSVTLFYGAYLLLKKPAQKV